MTSFEYDLDLTKGLMPQIQALIAPPISEEAQRSARRTRDRDRDPSHPYFRRPGKGHNRDLCDACREGGDLLCCDKCPASFHLQCHEPPLEESDIPLGQFFCHSCTYAKSLFEKEVENKPSTSNSDGNLKKTSSNSEGSQVRHGLDMLIAAASASNPKQFELPRELTLPVIFPGSDKVQPRGRRTLANLRKRSHELDSGGLVPLPAKVCFECRKSCRKGPLIACDYCPLLWHQDCLDPPLTSLPSGMWMCPNHPQQYIDSALITSSATERVRLWDRYTGPVDQDAIKMEFVRKARRLHYLYPGGTNFRFRSKLLAPRYRVRVPDTIIQQYKFPPPLASSLRDLIREKHQTITTPRPTQEEQDAWLSGLVSLQISLASRMTTDNENDNDRDLSNGNYANFKPEVCPNCRKHKFDSDSSDETLNIDKCSCSSIPNSLTNGDCHLNGIMESTNDNVFNKTLSHIKSTSNNVQSPKQNNLFNCLNSKILNLKGVSSNSINSSSIKNCLFNSSEDSDFDLSNLDEKLIYILAYQRLQQLKANNNSSLMPSSNIKNESKSSTSTSDTHPQKDKSPIKREEVKASITSLAPNGACLPMLGNNFTIGTGSDMDLCLSLHGHCNYVSSKHAIIYFDSDTRHYELLNYSEHGTTVNNILYSCDLSERNKNSSQDEKDDEIDKTILLQRKLIRELVDKHRQRKHEEDTQHCNHEPTKRLPVYQRLMSTSPPSSCECEVSSAELIGREGAGWEGSALLHHGCHIKFGCQHYVFSIHEQRSTFFINSMNEMTNTIPK